MTDKPDDDTPDTTPAGKRMKRQQHGGALQPGGNSRPKHPTARDCSDDCRKRFYQLIPAVHRKAKGGKNGAAKDSDQLRAAELLVKWGMSDTVSMSDVRKALQGTLDVIDNTLPPELADAVRQRIAPLWMRVWAA